MRPRSLIHSFKSHCSRHTVPMQVHIPGVSRKSISTVNRFLFCFCFSCSSGRTCRVNSRMFLDRQHAWSWHCHVSEVNFVGI